jgi:hypothetical protein
MDCCFEPFLTFFRLQLSQKQPEVSQILKSEKFNLSKPMTRPDLFLILFLPYFLPFHQPFQRIDSIQTRHRLVNFSRLDIKTPLNRW